MVRETRHLLIGNLPSNLNEERIIEHFKKYGKVQSVKFLSKEQNSSCNNDYCATIAFIDIKSASKAHNAENKIEDRILKTNYYEPPANLTSSSAIFIHESRGDLTVDNSNNLTGSTVTNSNQSLQNQSSSQTIRSSVVSRHLLTNSNRLTDDRIYDRISNDNSYKRHYNDDNRRTNSNNRNHHDSERNNSHFRQYTNRSNVGSTNSSSNHFTESRYSNNSSNNLTSNSISNNTNNSINSNNELDDCNININNSTNSGSISQRLFSCSSRNNSLTQGTCGNTSNNICNNSNNGRGLSSNVLNNCSTMNGSSSLINLPSVVSSVSNLNGNNLNSMISPTVTSPGSSSSSFHLNSNSQTGSAVGVTGKSAATSASLSMLTKKTITSSNISSVSSSNNKKAKKKKKKRKKSSSSSYHQSSSHHHNHSHRSGGSSTPSSTAQLSSNISGSYHHNLHNSSSSTSRKHHHSSRSSSTVQDVLSYGINSGRHGNTSSRSISPSSVESSEKEQNCLISTRCSSSMSCSDLEDEHHTHHPSHHLHSHHSHHNSSLHSMRNDNTTNQLNNNLSGSIINSCGNVNSSNSGQPINNEQIGNHLGTNSNVQLNSSNHHHHSHFHLSNSSNSSNSSGNCGINNHNISSTGLLQTSVINNSSNVNSQSQVSSNNNCSGGSHHNQFVLNNVHSPIDDEDANTPISPNSSTSNLSSASSSRVSSRRCSLSPPMSLSRKHSTNGSLRFSSYKNSAHLTNSSNNCSSVTSTANTGIISNNLNCNNSQSSPENVSNSAITNQSSKLNPNTSSLHYNQFSHCNSNENSKLNSDYNSNLDYNEKEVFSDQNTNISNNLNSTTNNNGKPLAICVRNLPVRSTDTSLKDGLFHEYKKHGKVTMVKVIGQGTDRFAVVCFKKNEDVEKALEVSRDKQFFGCKIEVTPHEGLDGEDNDFRPLEAELDEYHPKATRTLFVGNLEKDITTSQLRQHFEQFGEIIEIDIKKQGTSTYAFIQYSDIFSVVKAMRKLDGENLGNSTNRIKLGFGKSMPTNCVWLHGILESTSEKTLNRQCSRFGSVSNLVIDRQKGNCLVFYDTIELAQITVTDLKGRLFNNRRLQVDFASRECQNSFYQKLENNSNSQNYSSHLSSNRNSLMSISNHSNSTGNTLSNSISSTSTNYEKGTNTNRLTNRLNSLNNSPNNNLPPLPHTQWSNLRSQRSSENYNNRAQPTSTCSNLNSTSSRHGSNISAKNFDAVNEDYGNSFDTDFFDEQNVHSNLVSSHSNNSNSVSELRNSRSSEISEDKLRGRSNSPHRSLECSENNLSKVDRQVEDKNFVISKNEDFSTNTVKERFNRRNSEDNTYENWKSNDQADRHFYKNRSKNNSALNQSSTHYHHFHHREENLNFRNSLNNSNFKRHSQSISPPSPSNSSSHINLTNETSSNNENIHSNLSKRKIILPLVLPLPEFALSCRLDSKFSSNFKDLSNKDIKDSLSKVSNSENNSKNDVLKPLSIKCEDNNTSKENTIMSPLNSLSPVHVNFPTKHFSRSKSENVNSLNSTDFINNEKEILALNNDMLIKKSKKTVYVASPQSPLATNSSTNVIKSSNIHTNIPNTITKSLSFEERIKALDEKFSVWSSTNSNPNSNLDKEVSTSSTMLCTTSSINQSNKNSSTITVDDNIKTNDKLNINSNINKSLEDVKVVNSNSNNEINLTETILLNTPASSTTLTIDYSKYNIKKKSQTNSSCNSNSARSEPSDIVKSLLSKSSIFDQDSKRLEHINEKYEPKDAGTQANNNSSNTSSQPSPKTEISQSNSNQTNSKSQSNIRTKAAAKEFVCNQTSSSLSNIAEKDENNKNLTSNELSNDSKKEISNNQETKLLSTNSNNTKSVTKATNESENLLNNQLKNTNKDNLKDEKLNRKSSISAKDNMGNNKDKEHKKTIDNTIISKSQVSSNIHSKKKEKELNHHLKTDKKSDKKIHTNSLEQNKLDTDRQLADINKKSCLKSEKNEKEKAGTNTSSNAHGKEKDGEKEISVKRKEKFLKEKHSSSSSMKDFYKGHIEFDKDQENPKFIKKSKKSLSLDLSNNEINNMGLSKTNKDHEKDSEIQKPTKLKKSYNKDNTIDFEEFMIDKETERATKRYLAEMKKLGITEAPTYFSMYDKVKARSSQNQSLKGQSSANNSGSSINRNKSDSDCFKTKSERDSDGSDSNSDSSDDESRRLIKNVKSQNFHMDKNESKDDSQSSDDEILFQPVSRNKSNKLSFNHRKRKVNCIQSSQSSSNETSSSSSDSEKEQKSSNCKENLDLKSKKKIRKHQLSKTPASLNWNTDSDDEEIIKPIKNKNSINSSSSFSKKSKNNQALTFNQDKKDKDLSKDSKECEVSNNKKRSLNDDSITSTKTNKDEKLKKKKLQKNTNVDASDFNSNKNLDKDKENDFKILLKEEKSKPHILKNDSIDSDDLSVNLHSSKNVLKKKKKKKDKISKQKDSISSKSKEISTKDGHEQLSPKICKQLKEDLELSDTSSDALSNFKYNIKPSKDFKSMKKEEFYFGQNSNKKQKEKINKVEETNKDKKIVLKESKKSFSSSDSDFENLYNIKESKHVKKQKKEKIREKSKTKEKEIDLDKSHEIDKDNEKDKDKIKELSKEKIRDKDKNKEKERDKLKEKLKERDKIKEKTREKTKNKSKSKDKIKDNENEIENNSENHKIKIKPEKTKDELVNEKSDSLIERKIKVEKESEEKTDLDSKSFISTHLEKEINKDNENKLKNKLKKAKNKNKHKNKNKYDSEHDEEIENESKTLAKNKFKSERENELDFKNETAKDSDKKTETKSDYGFERLSKKETKAAKETEAKIKKQSFSDNNIFSSKELSTGNEKDSQTKPRKDSLTDICLKIENKLDKESKFSHSNDGEKLKPKDFDKISNEFDINTKEKSQDKFVNEEKIELKSSKSKNDSKNDHKDKNLGVNLPSIGHKLSKKKDSNPEKDHKHKEISKSKSKETKTSIKSEDFILSKENFSKTKTSHSDNNTYSNELNKNDITDQNKNSSSKSNPDHRNNLYPDSNMFKDTKYSKTNSSSNKNNLVKPLEKMQRNDNENLDNANDLWVNEETPKCDIWSDITKSEESFTQYLNKGSISSTDEWGESDDEILSKYPLLSPLSNLSSKNISPLPINHHQSSSSQSVLSKDVLKTIKSPKNQESSIVYPNDSTSQNVLKLKKKELKNKEDKCKENNEERKKKIKKPKEHRDQKIKEEKKLSLNTEIYEKNIEKSSNLAVSEIKTEPIIAAAATIQSQIFFNSADSKTKAEKPCLMQPVSPFAEKHVQQMNTYPCKQNQRLLSEGNIIINSSKKELKDFDSIKINEILNEKRVLSPVKNNTEESNNSKMLLKNNEMMFSISEESSNDEFLPAIGISFSSNSSNSSINLINTNNNASFSNIAGLSKKEEKSLLEKNQSVRKYEEEAAIETKRLEAELSKSKDSDSNWKSFKDSNKEFFLDSISNERLNSSNNSSTSLTNLNTSINKVIPKKPNKSILLEDATAIFNVITSGEVKDPFLDSDEIHFKVTDCKDELDDQRKIEDDLAVSALLELEMNNDEVLSSQENVESPEISKTAKTSSSSTVSKEKTESVNKDSLPSDNNEIIPDEETSRLQIAEDLLNENSVDSDVFHSAPDDLPDTENALKGTKNNSELLCAEQEQSYTTKLSVSSSNNISKNDPKSNLLTKLNSLDSKSKICSRIEVNKSELLKENALDKETDSTLIEEENLEKSLKNFKTSSLINELVKKGLKNKEEIYLASKTETSFLHSRISINKKEIELPTSLAEVKQAIASTNINKEDIKPSIVTEEQLFKSEKQISNNISISLPEIQNNQLDVTKLDEDSLIDDSKVSINNATKPINVIIEQQRPKRGRKAKARKSSESEESFKLNPLSPNSLNLSSPLISPTSTQSLPVISLQSSNSTASNKLNERLRRSTRGLSANSESINNIIDEPQNDIPVEELAINNGEEDNVMSTDGKRKRGRKKKFENLISNLSTKVTDSKTTHSNNLIADTNIESSKNLSPYDVFEFNDSEEETSPTLPLMTLHGNTTKANEQSKNNLSVNASTLLLSTCSQENQKPDSNEMSSSVLNDVFTGQSKSVSSVEQTNVPIINQEIIQQSSDLSNIEVNQNSCDKEYTTELSQHGKISITIRLQQKDKDQTNLESASDLINEEKTSEDNNSNDLYNSVQKPMTRKSARLMSQVNKTTIDEVIEDVVKGIFDENIDSRNFENDILELEEDAFLNDYFEKSNDFNTDEDSKANKDSKNSRVTRSSVAKNSNNLDESINEDTIIESEENSSNISKTQFSTLSCSNSETRVELNEPVEINLKPNIINHPKTEVDNLTSVSQLISSSQTLNTVIACNDNLPPISDSELQNKRTVLKVELPIVAYSNKIQNEKESINSKLFEEIKKEETQISVNKVNLPVIAKSSAANINSNNLDRFGVQSSKITTEGISVMKVIVPEKDTKTSLSNIIQTIPNISERIHNSTTALKLKTGKGLNLEESLQSQSINLTRNQNLTNNSEVIPSSIVKTSVDSNIKNNTVIPQLDHLVPNPALSVDFPKNSFVSTSVISTINNSIVQSSSSLRPACSKSLNKQTTNLVVSQQNILPSPSIIAPISSINAEQNDETQELQLQHQMKMKNTKPSQLLLPTNHFAGQIPNQELSLLHQQMLLMQQHPQQQFLSNAYAAAAAALHPELRMPMNHLSPRFTFSPLNTSATNVLEKELDEKQLHQTKPQLQSQINKIKLKQLSEHQEKVIQELGNLENMHPPSLINSLRLPVNVSHPSNSMPPNFSSIRGPLPTHLLSPLESNQQQRFTESPAIIHGNVNSFTRTPLLSPSLKEMKPQLIPQAHSNPNKTFEVPQRPHSTFSVSAINSPSPGFQNNLLPTNSSIAPTSQLSPSLNYRKDLPSPMGVMDIPEQIHIPRKLHKAYAVSQQQSKEAANMMLNNILPYHQLPLPAHQSNPVNIHLSSNPQHSLIPNTSLSYQQQVSNIALQQMNSQINNPIEFSQPQPSGGDSVLIQKYPKLWQGLLALKNDQAAVQMHFVTGNSIIAQNALPPILADGTGAVPLRIAQRMRLEQTQLDGVCRKMQQVDEHCILLALPCGRDHMDVISQSNNLRTGFIQYLQSKQAAGIINTNAPGTNQPAYVVHIFPSCEFSNENLARIAPDLLVSIAEIAHLLVVIATV